MSSPTSNNQSSDSQHTSDESPVAAAAAAARPAVTGIATLPVELLLKVTDYCNSAKDLNALARTCRGFYNSVNPALYRWHVTRQGAIAALWAATFGVVGTFRHLSAAGADYRFMRNELGYEYAPLTTAARHGRDEVVTWLIQNTDVANHETALQCALAEAVTAGHAYTCRVLVQHGARFRVLARAEKVILVRDAVRQGKPWILSALEECLSADEVRYLVWESSWEDEPQPNAVWDRPDWASSVSVGGEW
jgi:hypothetical protein